MGKGQHVDCTIPMAKVKQRRNTKCFGLIHSISESRVMKTGTTGRTAEKDLEEIDNFILKYRDLSCFSSYG